MNMRRAGLMGVVLVAMGGVWGADATDRGQERDAAQAAPAGVDDGARDAAQTAPIVASGKPDADVMRKWSRSCALCHVDGNALAPRVGVAEEWQPRLAKGMDVLMDHTINGFNKMPPLGYCMSCEAEDFRALIEFMAGAQQ